jgi:effector-binding domain-containing protein
MSILAFAAGSPNTISADSIQNVRVTVKEIEPFSYCFVSHTGAFGDLSSVLNDLLALMQSQNLAPAGDLIAVYHISPTQGIPEVIDYEVGFPISPQFFLRPDSGLQKKVWDYTNVAAAEHKGPYAGTEDTIDQMLEWIETNNYIQDGPILGRFLVIPTDTVRPSELRTEIWIPIKKQ